MIVAVSAALTVGSFIVMHLWNALLPELFHLPVVTFWQTIGLLLLSKIFFGGFNHHRGHHGRFGGYKRRDFANLSPEEKEKIMNRWSDCCGSHHGRWGHHDSECCEDKKQPSEK